ncbi:MAG: hypothetical protein ACE5EO_00290 [Candidatus Krumholzibacteriia bacterium]
MRTVSGLLFVLCLAMPALAGPPINGVYQSTDLGGPMLAGRYSVSWTAPNGALSVGNTTDKFSWDGLTLGTQWWMYCAELAIPPSLIDDTVDVNGNGTQTWSGTFTGGFCILAGNGPWGDGSQPSYMAPYTSYSEVKTLTFSNFQVVGVVSSVNVQAGPFVGFNNACMSLSISNQDELATTDTAALPADFPGFIDPLTCSSTRTMGSWGTSDGFTLVILGCTVPVEESTWGAIKALYNE